MFFFSYLVQELLQDVTTRNLVIYSYITNI